MRWFTSIINILIILCMALIGIIIGYGGFDIHVLDRTIRCQSLANPVLILFGMIVIRFFLWIGGKNSLTVLGSVLVTAVMGECILRLIHPSMAMPVLKEMTEYSEEMGYRMVPSLKDKNIQVNSHGLRDIERDWKKSKGVKRILGIGDSFTFGNQVKLEDCYLKQLERKLNRKGPDCWDVINAGVSGYNMWQYAAYLEHFGYKYEPDIITIGLYFDDFYGDPANQKKEMAQKNNNNNKRYRSMQHFLLVNYFRNAIDALLYRYRSFLRAGWLRSIEERRNYILDNRYYLVLTGRAPESYYQRFENHLKRIKNMASSGTARVLVIFIADVVQLHHPELQAINQIVKQICDRCGVELVDTTPMFEKQEDIRTLYLLPRDAHTSTKGHRIIAEAIERKLQEMYVTEQN